MLFNTSDHPDSDVINEIYNEANRLYGPKALITGDFAWFASIGLKLPRFVYVYCYEKGKFTYTASNNKRYKFIPIDTMSHSRFPFVNQLMYLEFIDDAEITPGIYSTLSESYAEFDPYKLMFRNSSYRNYQWYNSPHTPIRHIDNYLKKSSMIQYKGYNVYLFHKLVVEYLNSDLQINQIQNSHMLWQKKVATRRMQINMIGKCLKVPADVVSGTSMYIFNYYKY